ncbi:MAG: hypothetical protein AB2653_02830, partial [Candidatus Thiodiazotropha endolucinida]
LALVSLGLHIPFIQKAANEREWLQMYISFWLLGIDGLDAASRTLRFDHGCHAACKKPYPKTASIA